MEHHSAHSGSDHFLLDDDNIVTNRCLKLNFNQNYSKINDETDDHTENSEDSPLLINDCFEEQEDCNIHCHDSLSANDDNKAWTKLISASVFCFLFMIAELIGGYLAESLAIMTDAAHLFSDFIGFLISILAIWLGRKPQTKFMTFGYYRAEVVGALLSVLTIWLLAAIFLVLALRRLYKDEFNIQADTMIIVASLGLIVNIVMGAILHGLCHTHSHGTASSALPSTSGNINVRAAAAHVIGDLLQSFGVLLAATIIKIFPEAKIADPICTIIFSVIVIFTTARVGRDSIWLLMEGSPISRDQIVIELRKIANVRHIHDLYIWTLAPGRNIVVTHLAVDNHCDRDLVIKEAVSSIKSQIPIYSCTVQVESHNPDAISNCRQCPKREC